MDFIKKLIGAVNEYLERNKISRENFAKLLNEDFNQINDFLNEENYDIKLLTINNMVNFCNIRIIFLNEGIEFEDENIKY